MRENIVQMLTEYRKIFPTDMSVGRFIEYLKNNPNCTDRKNMNGHITVSGFVLRNKNGKDEVLVLYHKTFQKYMQPGGHMDPPDNSPQEAAIREVKEETGLDVVPVDGVFGNIPISIDAHRIKANEKKNEDAHTHFDLCFLLKLENENQEILNHDGGVDDAKWVDLEGINEKSNNVIFKAANHFKKFS